MRHIPCFELRPHDMLEKEMPMPIGAYVRSVGKKALEIATKTGNLQLGCEYYWEQVNGRIALYRRDSEIHYAINLAHRRRPIDLRYTPDNQKEYFFLRST